MLFVLFSFVLLALLNMFTLWLIRELAKELQWIHNWIAQREGTVGKP